ncbi:MAG: sulfite oxidase heme-binding subunit YedZ [Gammaproteobacteria bacterium]
MRSPFAKPILFILCLVPFSSLVWRGFYGDLGANPIETITRDLGDRNLQFLYLTLAISPLRQWFGWSVLLRFRRMLGLFVFFYVFLHFLVWFVADHSFDFSEMLEDIVKRPYIALGFSAFVLLIPLAATSNQAMIRRLGRDWKILHRLVYVIALLGILHFLWLVKADYLKAGTYAVIGGLLLLQRVDFKKWLDLKVLVRSGKPA